VEGIDIDAIKRQTDIAAVIGEYVALTRQGKEYTGLCPFHKERSPSFCVVPDKGFYYCFGCGETGDVLDFIQATRHVSMREAAEMLGAGRTSPPANYQKQVAEKPPVKRITRVPPRHAAIDQPPTQKSCRQPGGGFLDIMRKSFWRYTDERGNLAFFVARFEWGAGEMKKKETPQYTYGSTDGGATFRWWWGHFSEPRFLFNLKEITDEPTKPVLIVEGEKAADAAAKLLPMYVVTTWAGGTNAIEKTDWSPLAGRKILVWPDNDDPGRDAAEAIAQLVQRPSEIKILTPGDSLEKGWDAADALESGWDKKMTLTWARDWHRVWQPPAVPVVAAPAAPDSPAADEEMPPPVPAADDPECYSWGQPSDPFRTMRAPDWNPEHFPESIARFATDAGRRAGIDPGSIAMMCLVVCASVIHDDIQIAVKRADTGWKESARLWLMLVGDPSVKKSPAIKQAVEPVKAIGRKLLDDYGIAIRNYDREMEDWALQKKNAAKIGSLCPEAPIKPIPQRLWVDDVTQEKLVDILQGTNRGVLAIHDELTGWLGQMDAYRGKSSSGASKDVSFYLRCYNGDSAVYDRVSKDTIHVKRLSVSMIGGIQPGAYSSLRLPDDGLIQRFMPILARKTKEHDCQPDEEAEKEYRKLVYHLFKVDPAPDSRLIRLTPEAQVWRERFFEKIDEMMDATKQVSSPLASSFGKYSGLWARLALTQHCIECRSNRVHPQAADVSEEVAMRVTRLMTEFLRPHLMVFMLGAKQDGGSVADHVRWIAGYILARKERLLTNRNVMRAYKQWIKVDGREQLRSYEMLEALDWIRPIKERSTDNTKPNRFVVNPAVFAMFERQAEFETKARAMIRDQMKDLLVGESRVEQIQQEEEESEG
jgi:hypothetical protein